ncbi:MAG TPA: sodium/solute symporter, partial [Chitinophagales bacterium]|nr:sodium/solute symporter [Chitinophagales bacterium]
VVVYLTSILYLGALAVNSISGLPITVCMYGLAVFAVVITLGGMKVIGYTDIIQVVFLVAGGLATTYLALDLVAEHFGSSGAASGFSLMFTHANEHFHMILDRDNPNYLDLPGLTVLLGGMWIANLNYWGCNQYITQRALGAALPTARNGILFAAFLKLLMPVIVVLPGIAAFVLYQQNTDIPSMMIQDGEVNPDKAYPMLLNLLPVGLKGLSFAALTAAVVASLAGKANSISTIFTLDIFKKRIDPKADEYKTVWVGKVTIIAAMGIAVIIAPLMGIDKKGGFQYIQEYTGFVSPGVFAMFIMGFFWRKTTSHAALFAIVGGFLFSLLLKFLPQMAELSALAPIGFSAPNSKGVYEIPFLDRMGIVFVVCAAGMWLISAFENARGVKPKPLKADTSLFRVSNAFAAGALIVCGILAALYGVFW